MSAHPEDHEGDHDDGGGRDDAAAIRQTIDSHEIPRVWRDARILSGPLCRGSGRAFLGASAGKDNQSVNQFSITTTTAASGSISAFNTFTPENQGTIMISREKHNQMANAIRFLSMDAIEKAKEKFLKGK